MPKIISIGKVGIYINANDHLPPHAHVRFKERELRINLKTLTVMSSSFSKKDTRLVVELLNKKLIIAYLFAVWEHYHGEI